MQTIPALVHTLRWEAEDTISVEVRPVGSGEFPPFTPGAHVDLHLPNGLGRSYSLCNSADERHRYDLQAPMTLHFDDEIGAPPDLRRMLAEKAPAAGLHLYACGPTPMLDAFEKHCGALGLRNAHMERFATVEHEPAGDARGSFTVHLARSKRTVTVTPEKSILDTVLEAGIDVGYSCCEGVCGACETKVLEGEPDHRDSILSANERAKNTSMMICVSGCKSKSLTPDL